MSKDHAFHSKMISNMLYDDDTDNPKIPLPNVEYRELGYVKQFLEYYNSQPTLEIETPLLHKSLDKLFDDPFYRLFAKTISEDIELNVAMCNAANYLEIPPLHNLCIATFMIVHMADATPDIIQKWYT